MKRFIGPSLALVGLVLATLVFAQTRRAPGDQEEERQLPSGKSQQEEILKADHEKSLKDASRLVDLSQQLKTELEKNDRHVVSVTSIKNTEEIEKLAKRIRARLRRY